MSANGLYKEIFIPAVLNPGTIRDLINQLGECEKDKVRFVVLKGSGTVFCNGLDLAWVANSEASDHRKDVQLYADFLKKLQSGKFISIALVTGAVSGGGMGIVCACDHVITSASGTFSLPEGLLGLIPGMILPALLNRLSPQRIKKMVFTGKKYPAAMALEWGIADEVADDQQKALEEAISNLRHCKTSSVEDIKGILNSAYNNNDALAQLGMELLNTRLQEPEIKQRLKDISDFM